MLTSTIGTQGKQQHNFNMQLYLELELHMNELIPTKLAIRLFVDLFQSENVHYIIIISTCNIDTVS